MLAGAAASLLDNFSTAMAFIGDREALRLSRFRLGPLRRS